MPRPCKYSSRIAAAICERLKLGWTRAAAAEAVGIHRSTLRAWLANEDAQLTREDHAEFSAMVEAAEAEAEGACAEVILKAGQMGEWKAAESWLKRRRRQEWGDAAAVEVNGRVSYVLDLGADTDQPEDGTQDPAGEAGD